MDKEKGFQLFDNYDEDGQLCLFDADYDDWDEDWVEEDAEPVKVTEPVNEAKPVREEPPKSEEKVPSVPKVAKQSISAPEEKYTGPEIRVRYCSTCGKLLFVKEDASGYSSECNHCEIKYFQKA